MSDVHTIELAQAVVAAEGALRAALANATEAEADRRGEVLAYLGERLTNTAAVGLAALRAKAAAIMATADRHADGSPMLVDAHERLVWSLLTDLTREMP